MSTTTDTALLRSASGDALRKLATETGPKGHATKHARMAQAEIDRRATNRAANRTPVPSSQVTEVQLDELTIQARKVAGRIARETAGEVAQPGDIVRTSIRLRKDLLGVIAEVGAEQFLATFGS